MAEMGYVLSSEEMSPKEMVRNARRAEEAGFTTAWISDHYHPWIGAGQEPVRVERDRRYRHRHRRYTSRHRRHLSHHTHPPCDNRPGHGDFGGDAGGSLLVRHRQRREPQRAYTRGPLASDRREA